MSRHHPRSRTADHPIVGVAEALVEAVDDPEKEGRVRLRLPWFDAGLVTEWCRTSNLFAGGGYGSTWTPELGDEVLVGFVHGDLRYPVVLGGLYNGEDKPPAHRDQATNRKMLRTKRGHEVVLDDSDTSTGLTLRTQDGHLLRLDDQGKRLELTTRNGHRIVIDDAAGSLTLHATNISIEATQTVRITGQSIALN
jgi:uncharacterized protein involved in type VI secretion and phage assembly